MTILLYLILSPICSCDLGSYCLIKPIKVNKGQCSNPEMTHPTRLESVIRYQGLLGTFMYV